MLRNPILLHCGAAVAVTIAVSWLDVKPLGVFFLLLLALWIYKTRCSASISIILPGHINAKLLQWHDRIVQLRKESPAIFCAIVSACLGLLAVVGHLISGSSFVVFGLIAAGLISTKYNFQIFKVENKEGFMWVETPDHEVDEFLPEVNESNLFVLQRASDHAAIDNSSVTGEDDRSEEIPADLMIPDSIPEIDEHSDNSSDEELILKQPKISQNTDGIEFKTGYFNASISSSSSDDDSISKGLSFQSYSAVDGRAPHMARQQPVQEVQQQISNLLPNLVTNLVSWSVGNQLLNPTKSETTDSKKQQSQPQLPQQQLGTDSSDESDFELLDTDDLNSI